MASKDLGGNFFVNHGVSAPPDATVWVALRPEKVGISRVPPAAEGEGNRVRAVVKEIAYLGDVSVYLVQLATGRMVRITSAQHAAPGRGLRPHHLGRVSLALLGPVSPVVVTQ